ncbi:MAG: DnaK suppressor protein [Acidobacteriota bacterium]|jgi:DnaK suppressor protein|nr:DnaK suppressor protein [Acidobacteriota bacterium]
MDADRIEHFRKLLIDELKRHSDNVRGDQAAAIEAHDDSVKDSVEVSQQDFDQEMALNLGDRESQAVADIDQALMRLEEGTYGLCLRCGKPLDERRLEALPTARYDAACQAMIEEDSGIADAPTL